MNRDIKFEYGFESVNGIVKKVYSLYEIPNISQKCDMWNILPVKYVRQSIGKTDKNGVGLFEGDYNSDEDVIVWCDNCMSWQLACYDLETKEVVVECHFCEGNFLLSEVIGDFVKVGNIYEKTN